MGWGCSEDKAAGVVDRKKPADLGISWASKRVWSVPSIILDPLDYGLSQVMLTFVAEVPRELQETAQGQAAFKCTLLHGL